MKFIFKHWEYTIISGFVIYYLVWLVNGQIKDARIPKNKEVVAMPPPEIEINKEVDLTQPGNYPYASRTDSYGINHIDRSDSSAIMTLIANHFCRSVDTIALEKYEMYTANYYAYGADFNNSLYHFHNPESPLHYEAAGPEAFVCRITYVGGQLDSIRWYPDGQEDKYIMTARDSDWRLAGMPYRPITPVLEALFGQCKTKSGRKLRRRVQ